MAELEGSIRLMGKTAAQWAVYATPLLSRQPGIETDSGQMKIGDGVSLWPALDYVGTSGGGTWGSITGTLSSQEDLQSALDAKENLANKKSTVTPSATDYPNSNGLISYVQTELNTVIRDQGSYDASSNLFPTTGGSGALGAIEKGNQFTISVNGTLGGTAVTAPYSIIRALVNTPGQTAANWYVLPTSTPVVPTVTTYDISSVRFSGKYYTLPYAGIITNNSSWNAGFYTYPVTIGEAHSISGLRFNVTGAVAASTVRVAIWAANSAGYPAALLYDTGEIPTTTTGEKTVTFTSNIALSGKIFFYGLRASSSSVSLASISSANIIPVLERASGSSTSPQNYFLSSAGTPANPFTAGQTLFASGCPIVGFLRV